MYLSQFSLTRSIFLFSFACSHSHSSSRLHYPQSNSQGLLFFFPSSPNGRMAFLFFFIFLHFSSFHQFTINASTQALTFGSTNFFFFSSPLGRKALMHQPISFLIFLLSVSNTITAQEENRLTFVLVQSPL